MYIFIYKGTRTVRRHEKQVTPNLLARSHGTPSRQWSHFVGELHSLTARTGAHARTNSAKKDFFVHYYPTVCF